MEVEVIASDSFKDYGSNHDNKSQRTNGLAEEDASSETKERFNFLKLSRRRKVILSLTIVGRFFVTSALSIFNPVFPIEAEEKGISHFLQNLSFGILYVAIVLSAPIFGKYLETLGPKFTTIASMYVAAIVNIGIGLLHLADGGTSYLVVILICRVMLGLGFSGHATATQTIVSYEFLDHVGVANGLLQTAMITGYMAGPALSGFLFEVLGYPSVFYVVGILIFINALLGQFFMPNVKTQDAESESESESELTATTLLKRPFFLVLMVSLTISSTGSSNIDSTLTNHVTPLHLSMAVVGLLFTLLDVLDAVANLVLSYLTDHGNIEGPVIVFSHSVGVIAYLLVAPASFLPFIPFSLSTICVGLALAGVALGGVLVPIMTCIIKYSSSELGYEMNLKNLGVISGLFNSVLMLGCFMGQFVLGIFQTVYTIADGYTLVAFLNLTMAISIALTFITRRVLSQRENEKKHDKLNYQRMNEEESVP